MGDHPNHSVGQLEGTITIMTYSDEEVEEASKIVMAMSPEEFEEAAIKIGLIKNKDHRPGWSRKWR